MSFFFCLWGNLVPRAFPLKKIGGPIFKGKALGTRLSMGSGGGGGREWREEACPKPPPRFQEGLGDLPFVHSTSHDTSVTAIYQTLKILKQNSM